MKRKIETSEFEACFILVTGNIDKKKNITAGIQGTTKTLKYKNLLETVIGKSLKKNYQINYVRNYEHNTNIIIMVHKKFDMRQIVKN